MGVEPVTTRFLVVVLTTKLLGRMPVITPTTNEPTHAAICFRAAGRRAGTFWFFSPWAGVFTYQKKYRTPSAAAGFGLKEKAAKKPHLGRICLLTYLLSYMRTMPPSNPRSRLAFAPKRLGATDVTRAVSCTCA